MTIAFTADGVLRRPFRLPCAFAAYVLAALVAVATQRHTVTTPLR